MNLKSESRLVQSSRVWGFGVDFSASLGNPSAGERRIHLCDIRIVELVEEVVGIAVEQALELVEQGWLRFPQS